VTAGSAALRHELRTPLNHIIGYSELLLEEVVEGERKALEPGLRQVHADARQLLGLINNLLTPSGGDAEAVDLALVRGELLPPLERILAGGEALKQQAAGLGAAQLLPDLGRILSAAGTLRALLGQQAAAGGQLESAAGAGAGEGAVGRGAILVVDDDEGNREILARRLRRQGYRVEVAAGGRQALGTLGATAVDLVLLDVMMPDMDGYAVLQRLKADARLRDIPVLMISALDELDSVVRCIQLGAEDYLSKPFEPVLLQARVGACLEKKRLHDQEVRHRQELAEWNRTLEQRVEQQVAQLERLGRLKRFFSPQLAELIVAGGAEDPLKTHRREVTVVFLDLRGFTAFAETADPEEVMGVLREYHAAMGELILAHEGTLERFTGDGMMVFFNDPVPVPDPAERAIRMAVAMRDRVDELTVKWQKRGYDLQLGVGIAQGYATIGAIGFEGRWDYGAIGTVTNLAARLCAEAKPGQILVPQRLLGAVENFAEAEPVGELFLKGFHRAIPAHNVLRLKG
jgi:class 3 adenylate cyclase/CheY-like chemotaxis protein